MLFSSFPAIEVRKDKHNESTKESAFESLGEKAQPKPCKGMKGVIEEGEETIEELKKEGELAADLGLIAAAQKVEHYEISAYGTARCLARQLRERQVAKLLSHTLEEEERADFLLSELANPLLHNATLEENEQTQTTKAKSQKA